MHPGWLSRNIYFLRRRNFFLFSPRSRLGPLKRGISRMSRKKTLLSMKATWPRVKSVDSVLMNFPWHYVLSALTRRVCPAILQISKYYIRTHNSIHGSRVDEKFLWLSRDERGRVPSKISQGHSFRKEISPTAPPAGRLNVDTYIELFLTRIFAHQEFQHLQLETKV